MSNFLAQVAMTIGEYCSPSKLHYFFFLPLASAARGIALAPNTCGSSGNSAAGVAVGEGVGVGVEGALIKLAL